MKRSTKNKRLNQHWNIDPSQIPINKARGNTSCMYVQVNILSPASGSPIITLWHQGTQENNIHSQHTQYILTITKTYPTKIHPNKLYHTIPP